MPKVLQYPHFLFVQTHAAGAVRDENGDWSRSSSDWTLIGPCREETGGRGSKVMLTDGRTVTFTALIQCPFGSPKIAEGSRIMIANDEGGTDVRVTGECLKSDPGQLHTRHWI